MDSDPRARVVPSMGLAHALLLLATAAAYIGVIAASLVPGDLRPNTGVVPGPVEHATAYLVLGALSSITALPSGRIWRTLFGNVALAAILETLQLIVPGRAAAPVDFLASSTGALFAAIAVYLLQGRR